MDRNSGTHMDASAAIRIAVTDMDHNLITPTSLDPRSRIRAVEDCGPLEREPVGGDVRFGDIEKVLACYAGWILCFVVGVYVVSFFRLRIDKPTGTIFGCRALLPLRHGAVVALEV